MSVVVGCLVAILSLLAAWHSHSENARLRSEQWRTILSLKRLRFDREIEYFQETQGRLPESLDDYIGKQYHPMSPSELADGWGRRFVYVVSGTNWTLYSFGKDGKPGGIGDDADLSNWNPYPEEAKIPPSLREFAFEIRITRSAALSTVVSGVLAGLLTFLSIRITELTRQNLLQSAKLAAIILAAATLLACLLASLEVPTH